jgi:hypothetical protein
MVDCDILVPMDDDILAPRLNKINRILKPTRRIFFFRSKSRKNLGVKRACPEQSWDGWPTRKFSRVHMSEDKVCTKDSCWSMILEDCQEWVPPVQEWMRCYKWYQSQPSRFHGRACARASCIWHMTHVGPEWSHGMEYVPTLDAKTWPKREGSWFGGR